WQLAVNRTPARLTAPTLCKWGRSHWPHEFFEMECIMLRNSLIAAVASTAIAIGTPAFAQGRGGGGGAGGPPAGVGAGAGASVQGQGSINASPMGGMNASPNSVLSAPPTTTTMPTTT